jgi:chemotaxis protein CheX
MEALMDSASWKIAHELLAHCCTMLFESLSLRVTRVKDRSAEPARRGGRCATFIGFGGTELRGAITLDLPTALVAQLHPTAISSDEIVKLQSGELPSDWRLQENLCDWAGELGNQLLGRMKSELSKHAITIQASMPATVWGEMVHAKKLRGEGSLELAFASGEHLVLVYFDGTALVPVDLTRAPTADAGGVPAEGDMMMLI